MSAFDPKQTLGPPFLVAKSSGTSGCLIELLGAPVGACCSVLRPRRAQLATWQISSTMHSAKSCVELPTAGRMPVDIQLSWRSIKPLAAIPHAFSYVVGI